MIARIWRGAARADDAAAYARYIQETGIEGYKKTPGNRGAWALWLSAMAAPEGPIWPGCFPAGRRRARFK